MIATAESPAAREVRERFAERTPKSAAVFERAREAFPGGDFRRAAFLGPNPTYIDHAQGAYLYDIDGNRYLDLNGNWTAMVAGHSHPHVVQAVQDAAAKSLALSAPTANAVDLAEAIKERVPSIERLRFACSGSEAVMFALRGARAFTGRTKIMKMAGAYHGTYDPVEDERSGVPQAAYDDVVLGRYNDAAYTERAITENKDELAAVIAGVGVGTEEPADGFLAFVADVCRRHGIVFILDEVVSLRLETGGAQERYGLKPDITVMGKIIGGGFAIGAFGGRADVLEVFSPQREHSAHHSGTFVATPVTMAAGLATLDLLDGEAIGRINRLGGRLRDGVQSTLDELEIPGNVDNVGSLVSLRLGADAEAPARDPGTADLLTLALMNRGVFARRNVFALATPMGEAEVDDTVRAVRESLIELREVLR
jgi:glutamate-1-semialdehyde 2,1-aminomutase